jgi:arylsulfatase A-like enzyme
VAGRLSSVPIAPETTRRRFLQAAGLAAAVVATREYPLGGARNDGPDVVVIVFDTLRFDHVFGDCARTPNMEALAREGLSFTRAFPEAMPTVPARNTILSGRRQFPFRDWRDHEDLTRSPGWEPLDSVGSAFTSVLRRAGYWTSYVTDNPFLGFSAPYESLRGSFDSFARRGGQVAGRDYGVSEAELRHWLPPPFEDPTTTERVYRYLANGRYAHDESESFAARVFRDAVAQLDRAARRRPFAMVVDSFQPHEPWTPPRKYIDLYGDPDYRGPEPSRPLYKLVEEYLSDAEAEVFLPRMRALYAAEVTMSDRWLGVFLDRLRELRLYDETLFVLVSDHGFFLGEYGYTGKSSAMLHPQLTRVPLVIVHPERRGAGRRSDYFASTHDLAPTILSMVGTPAPPEMDGVDLSGLFAGRSLPRRSYAYGGYTNSFFLRDSEWAMSGVNLPGDFQLYDLRADPGETDNLAGRHPEKAAELYELVTHRAGGRLPYYPD